MGDAEQGPAEHLDLFERMVLIRRFEEKVAEIFHQGHIAGYCHLYIGQEAVAVGSHAAARPTDPWVTGYRDHAIALLKGCEPRRVMAELCGRATGVSKGKGGSMHMFHVAERFYGGTGIVAGNLPIACGLAFAAEYRGTDDVVLALFGDGAINEGAFHEAMNLASLWSLPVVFLCENNFFGMGTPVDVASTETDLTRRALGYKMRVDKMDGMDVLAVREVMGRAVAYARRSRKPTFVEAITYRFVGHSMTDPQVYRTPEDVEAWKKKDPIDGIRRRILEADPAQAEALAEIERRVDEVVENAARFALESEEPPPEELWTDVLKG